MTKRAVLYARINNDDGPGLAEQLRLCRECAQERGWLVMTELSDRGVSGLSVQATEVEQALSMARSGEFDVLVVCDPHRISRDINRLVAITQEFEQANVHVRFAGNHSSTKGG